MDFLSNDWWLWFFPHYSISIGLIMGTISAILKVKAMADDGTPNNQIVDYLIGLFKK
jgi:cytochrome c-type biogenesis protein CcmH/NrfF